MGGADGKPGRFTMQPAGADKGDVIGKERSRSLKAGDLFTVETGGGGGYGDPRERAVELIQRDVDRGYVSHDAAIKDYGVKIDAEGRVSR